MKKLFTFVISLLFFYGVANAQYCASGATSTVDDDIGQVIFGSMANPAVAPSPLLSNPLSVNTYSNFTATVPPSTYFLGQSYPISILQINSSQFFYTCWANVWIDFNHNNTFDPTELVFGGSSGTANPITGSIAIPGTSLTGPTRMRIVLQEGGTSTSTLACGSYTWGETEDYLVNIAPASPDDAGITGIFGPISGCGLSATTQVSCDITNFGSNPQFNIGVCFQVDNGPVFCEPTTVSLAPSTTGSYTFTATADLSVPGMHAVKVWTTLPNDGFSGNDTLIKYVLHKIPVTNYPYIMDFEASGPTLPSGWENSVADQGIDWEFTNQPTYPGPFPAGDHTLGTGYYSVVDDYSDVDSAILITPCFDISSMSAPQFAFWYHSNNQFAPTPAYENFIHVDLLYNGGIVYDVIVPIGHKNTLWNQEIIDLTPYTPGVVGVRFRAENFNQGAAHNLAIDDINLKELLPFDASVPVLTNPGNGCGLTANEPISIAVVNMGYNSWSSVPLHYSVNGGTTVTEIYNGPAVPPGDTLFYTFTATANLGLPGTYSILTYSTLAGDTNTADDSLVSTITSIPTISNYPYYENFDQGPGGWAQGGTNSSWQLGTPSGAPIQSAYTSPNSWETNLTGSYNSAEESWVLSPCFDLSTLNAPVFEAAIAWDLEGSWDGVVLQASTDGGVTWSNVGNFGDPFNWYNGQGLITSPGSPFNPGNVGWNGSGTLGSGWVICKHDLNGLQNQPAVRLRFAFSADFSVQFDGFAFDNVRIYDKPQYDLGVSAFVTPTGGFCETPNVPVTVIVENFGSQAQNNISVHLDITGPVSVNLVQTLGAPLPVAATTNATFNWNATTGGTYLLKSYTSSLLDPINDNDTSYLTIVVYPIANTPTVNDDVLCTPDSTTLSVLAPQPGIIYFWYDAIGGNLLHTGTSYTTPYLTATTDYYVVGRSELIFNVGKPDDTGPGFNTTGNVNSGLVFDTFNPLTIDSVTVYPTSSGTMSVNVFDALGALVGTATTNIGSPAFLGAPVKCKIDIDIPTPGFGYRLLLASTSTALYYNYDGAVYPYTDPNNNISIVNTQNSFGTLYGYYYTFYDWRIKVLGCDSGYDSATVVVGAVPQPFLGADAITCSGYVVDATTAGGVSYAWNSGQTSPVIIVNNSGQYVTYVTNQYGCVGTDTINVTVLPTPSVNLGPDVTGCLTAATLNAGTNQPVGTTYLWSANTSYALTPSVNVTANGTYYVSITSPSGCSDSDTINVSLNGVDVDLGQDITACSSNVTLNAGNPGSTYLWSTGATTQSINVTSTGTYSVTVSKPGCSDSDVINVTFGTPPSVNLGPDQTACGGTILDAGNPGATYSWSNGATSQSIPVTQTGTYFVSVSLNGNCLVSDQINVTVNQAPTGSFIIQSSTPNTGYYQFNANNTTGSLPVTYNWNFGDGTTSNLQNPAHTYQSQGTFNVTLIVSNMCGNDTVTMSVFSNNTTSLDDLLTISDLQVYPNPSHGAFTVSSESLIADELSVEVLNVQGQSIYSQHLGKVSGFTHEVIIQNLAQGMYMVKLSDGKRSTYSKIVIE
ncbi:MAG: T9SS type A sorting domain-containing protein [Bacteroidia bacterium]|nr:T9SS type A sorting domain-containing protein [Bacteroidia bacterium]